ncbi:hypothetical protein [Nocardiopsis alborubida]|uniref:Uncharacterized protein n=1 Tax=Nocardiopsis alborubida TaxID=146802 RepID=A0A7X6MFD8_9ACTN|nr:hypothetical protein [Nocardiopsis alborubida]NKY98535.1 hypothetical protein [Nocardiopsis alborubida]
MSGELAFMLALCLVVLLGFGVLFMVRTHAPEDPLWRWALLCGIWGGFAAVLLLLVTDASWFAWMLDAGPEEEQACPPVLGRGLPWNDPGFVPDPGACAQDATAKLGWALTAALVALVCLVLRTRDTVLEAVGQQSDPREGASEHREGGEPAGN